MKKINIKQARLLLDIGKEVFIFIGDKAFNVIKSDFTGYLFDRGTIKELVKIRLGVDSNKWEYACTLENSILLN